VPSQRPVYADGIILPDERCGHLIDCRDLAALLEHAGPGKVSTKTFVDLGLTGAGG
jgi:hypothetical protein